MSKSVAKIKTTSKDIFADELKKFSQIFPQFISEGKVDFDALQAFLADKDALVDEKDKYTFTWAGKKQSFQAISRPSHATLNPKIDESVDFDNTQNLFIEGDNLEVLKLLQKHYHSKIKMIYIDPPYNTGKDFIYKDNFTEGKSDYFERIGATENGIQLESNSDAGGRYHSQWLSMMYPRLFLAKQLLKDDGVIFISIDDNEQHHLKMLMNEVFGESNFVCELIWEKKTGASDSKTIATITEYVFVYTKNINFSSNCTFAKNKDSYDLARYKHKDDFYQERGSFYYDNLDRGGLRYSDSLNFEITGINGESTYPNGRVEFLNDGWIWKWSKKKVKWGFDNGFLEIRKSNVKNSGYAVYYKNYLLVDNSNQPIDRAAPTKNLILGVKNQDGSSDIKEIFKSRYFDYPKPVKYISTILKYINFDSGDIVLDFFAGSATTGHAVMDLNKQDNGNRQFILVQIPEVIDKSSEAFKSNYKNIAEIGKERLRRAIKKYEFKAGFKVFSLASTNYNITKSYNGDDAKTLLNLEKLSIKEPLIDNFDPINLVYEIILKYGFSLNAKIERKNDFYLIKDNELDRKLAITLQNPINTKQIEGLKLATDDTLVCFDKSLTDTQKVNFLRNFNLRVI